MQYEERYAAHPDDAKGYDTDRLRREFLIEKLFEPDDIRLVYSAYDRLIVGGIMPVGRPLELTPIDPLKAPFSCIAVNSGSSTSAEKARYKPATTRSN